MTVVRSAPDLILNQITGKAVQHYVAAERIFLSESYRENLVEMDKHQKEAIAHLRRYRCFGGKANLFLSRAIAVPVARAIIILRTNIDVTEKDIEHLGSSPIDMLYVQEVLGRNLELYKLLLTLCEEALLESASESLSDLQDEAQNAFDDAYACYAAYLEDPAGFSVAEYSELAQELASAKALLLQVYQRVKTGERPARPYPIAEERWPTLERSAAALQDTRKDLEKAQKENASNAQIFAQLEACNQCCFMVVALFNVRHAHIMQQRAG
ncbi:MAG: hypothetical protein OSB62_04595 [Alphaproteobacteria bacterium]|nr:hypothetical protein [Alphaproteobacteria bacterium]